MLASLENYSEHPLGKALVRFVRERGAPLAQCSCVEIHKGLGITGEVAGKSVFVGGRRLMKDLAITIDAGTELTGRRWEAQGRAVTFFGWDGVLRGCLAFGDVPRFNACALIGQLKSRSIRSHMISGDSYLTTESVARQLSIDSFRSEMLPEEKVSVVRGLKENGALVAMVGDGINDAPALAEADLGIAMGSGTDIAMRAASVVLMDSDLEEIPQVFDLARRTMQVVRQNLFWAFFYNVLGITLAVSGFLNPIFAAVAMLLSSSSVVANSLRLTRATTR